MPVGFADYSTDLSSFAIDLHFVGIHFVAIDLHSETDLHSFETEQHFVETNLHFFETLQHFVGIRLQFFEIRQHSAVGPELEREDFGYFECLPLSQFGLAGLEVAELVYLN